MKTPLVRCDQVQWSFLGISMAGWNAILSLGGAAVIAWLALKPRARMSGWRPGDRRPDRASMLRVDQAGEYGATRIYAGQLAVLRRNSPAAKLIARMAGRNSAISTASTR